MAWWIWILLGFLLLAFELATTGFFLFFFGVGAITVGVLAGFDLLGPQWFQWLAFSGLSLLSLYLFRQPLMRRIRGVDGKTDVDVLVGATALALDEIPVDSIGRAELRGSTWKVKNLGPAPINIHQRCIVERVDGLMLCVRSN